MSPDHINILHSTAYLPPISWVQEIMKAEKVYIEAEETYPRQTYRNRCKLITANGIISLSIPVIRESGSKPITRDIQIFYDEPWQRLHWRTIDAAYSNSPFYLYYKDELKPFYETKYRFLLDFNNALATKLFNILGLKYEVELTTEFNINPVEVIDHRNTISPKSDPDPVKFKTYHQVFEERHGFIPDLSIIDLLFNEGPASIKVLGTRY